MSKIKTTWKDIEFHVLFPFENALIHTLEKYSDSKSRWMRPSVWLGCLRECVSRSYSKDRLKNYLTYWKLIEWERTVLWIYLAAYSGAYESIGRELRFLVEDMGQAIAIDKKFPNMNLESKVNEVSEKFRGKKLFLNFEITEKMKEELGGIWKILSGYVHPSKEIVKTAVTEGKIIFRLAEGQFNELLKIYTETLDIVIAVLLGYFPRAIEGFVEYNSNFVEPIKYELYNYGYWNSLSICNSKCPKSFNDPFFGHYNSEDHKQ